MKAQLNVQKFLNRRLMEAQAKNPGYSLRAFAQKLGIGAGPLSQILSGDRRVSRQMVERFCDALLLDPQERSQILGPFREPSFSPQSMGTGAEVDSEEYLKLTADQFKAVSEWYYFAILSLIKTTDFRKDPQWIANRLNISVSETNSAISRLLRLGMIEEKANTLVRTRARFRSSDEVENLPLRKSHFESLQLAQAALQNTPIELRDVTAITMPTHPSRLKEAKELIRKFEQDLCALLMDTPEPTEVYRATIALYPLTQISEQKKTKTQSQRKKELKNEK